ncbi:MAG: hypothetical protein NTX52_03700, partial [Planctomycetota bacterium]|nr:hypothetical protein [Planctomycetota bacterium]
PPHLSPVHFFCAQADENFPSVLSSVIAFIIGQGFAIFSLFSPDVWKIFEASFVVRQKAVNYELCHQ